MQQKTKVLSRFLLAALLLSLTACSGIETPGPRDPEAKPFAGVTLRVACPDETTLALLNEMAGGWSHREGLRAMETPLFDADGKAPPEGDVWVIPLSQLPRWAEANQLEKLPEELTRAGGSLAWQGLLPFYREPMLMWQGDKFAVPLLGDAPVCFYRIDLLNDRKHQDGLFARGRANLLKPQEWDWEDFTAVAEYFRDALKTASLPPIPSGDRDLDRLFYLASASLARRAIGSSSEASKGATENDLFAFHFDLHTGKPRVGEPGFVEALKLLQRMQQCRPGGKGEVQPWKEFRDGKAVLYLGDARHLGAFQEKGSAVKDRVGVCPVPGSRVFFAGRPERKMVSEAGQINRVPYVGGGAYVLVVPRQGKQKEAAFELLTELAGRRLSRQIVLSPYWGGGAVRGEHLELTWDSWRLDPKATISLGDTLRDTIQGHLRNPLFPLRVPREHEFRAALISKLRPALSDVKGADDEKARLTMNAVADEWSRLIEGKEAEHARLYRQSLGLSR